MHCMIDLETLDTASSALILSIGAVSFDKDKIDSEYYRTIKVDQSMIEDFTISASTLNWWFLQLDAMKEFSNSYMMLNDVLQEFSSFYKNFCDGEIWGNGSDFDNVILANAYKTRNIELPWSYNKNRCFRTIKSLYPKIDLEFKGVRHNALADALYQAQYLIELNKINSLNIL